MTPEQIEFIFTNTIYPSAKAGKYNIECTFYDDRGTVLATSPITYVLGYNDYNIVYTFDKITKSTVIIPANRIDKIALHSYDEPKQND